MSQQYVTPMTTRTYKNIAADYSLWIEYVDTLGLDSEDTFNQQTVEEKIDFLVQCFGPELEDDAANI
jgi:hypothetical protein